MENKRVYIAHARAVLGSNGRGYCSRGMRAFANRHDLNWEDFVTNGIDIETLRAIDDDMARAVIAEAEADNGQG